jgi:hypothetical protein
MVAPENPEIDSTVETMFLDPLCSSSILPYLQFFTKQVGQRKYILSYTEKAGLFTQRQNSTVMLLCSGDW